MNALENENTLAFPNNTFWTKSTFGNDVDLVVGALDTAQYPDATHPYTNVPLIVPGDPYDVWTINDQQAGQFFTVQAVAPEDMILQQRDSFGNWIDGPSVSRLESVVNADGPGDFANSISVRAGVAGDGFQGDHGAAFEYSLFAEVPDRDHFGFEDLSPGDAFVAEFVSADFDPLLGWLSDDGELIASDDDGGAGNLSRMMGIVPDSGEVNLVATGAGDDDFIGRHDETGGYELSLVTTSGFFPIVLENAPAGTFVVMAGGVSRGASLYDLTDDADGRFDIDAQTGLITVEDGAKIDYETAVAHEVEVTRTFLNGSTPPRVETLTIFVRDVNEAPTSINLDNADVEENASGAIIGLLSAEDQDIGDSHTYESSDNRFEVVDGQLKLIDGVSLDHDNEPSVPITIIATDEGGLIVEQFFTIDVVDVNEAPIAVDDEGGTTENLAVNIDVLANDTDVDDGDDSGNFSLDSVFIASVTGLIGAGTGVVSIDGNQLRFDPGSGFNELDEGDTATVVVDYTMSDEDGASAAAQATITVTGVNDAPVVTDVAVAAVEDGPGVSGTFLGDDADADDDGSTLTYSLTGLPSEGVVADIDNQTFTFDPEVDFQDLGDGETRDVTFGYTATDSQGAVSSIATVTITVTGVNDAPVLDVNTGKTVAEGSVELLSVTELSASDPDDTDAEIVYTVTTAPTQGYLALSDNQGEAITEFSQEDLALARVVYVHGGGEAMSDSFTFDVDDPDGSGPESQLFSIAVTPVNDAPVLDVNALIVQEGETKLVGPETLSASDSDTDPEDLTFTIGDLVAGRFERVSDPGAAINEFTQAELDSALIQFIHDGGEQPPAYTVTLSDGLDTIGPFAADISFEGVNDSPVVEDVTVSALEDGTPVIGSFEGDDVDPDDDGTTLSYAITSTPAEGSVFDNGDGTFTFDPGTDFQVLAVAETRDVTFDYTATDSQGAVSDAGTVTVIVSGANDTPTVEDVTALAIEDGAAVTGLFAGEDPDSDDGGDTLTYSRATLPSEGTVADINGDSFTFDPGTDFQDLAEGETREVTFDYTATDAHGAVSNTATVTVTVTGVNDAPDVEDVTVSASEDGAPVIGSFAGDDVDSDDDATTLSYDITSAAAEGSVSDNGDGTFTFDPEDGFQDLAVGETWEVTFDYTATDSQGAVSDAGTLTVIVSGANDAPTVEDVTASAAEDGAAVTGSFAGDDPDSDDGGETLTYSLATLPSEGTVADIDGDSFTFDPGTDFQDLAEGETREVTFDYTATDAHGAVSNTATVTVTVTGVNDAPTDLDLSNNVVSENASAGTIIGTIWATDPDGDDGLEYEITDDAGEAFDIDPVSGRLIVGNASELDFENPEFEGVYSIEVAVIDPEGEPYIQEMDIVVTDFNEAPTGIEIAGGAVFPDPGNGAVVATLTTNDPDVTPWSPVPESFSYALLDNARGRFALEDDEIVVADSGRIEEGESYELLVRSTDKGGLSVDQLVLISSIAPSPLLAAIPEQNDLIPFADDGGAVAAIVSKQEVAMCGASQFDPDVDGLLV